MKKVSFVLAILVSAALAACHHNKPAATAGSGSDLGSGSAMGSDMGSGSAAGSADTGSGGGAAGSGSAM